MTHTLATTYIGQLLRIRTGSRVSPVWRVIRYDRPSAKFTVRQLDTLRESTMVAEELDSAIQSGILTVVRL